MTSTVESREGFMEEIGMVVASKVYISGEVRGLCRGECARLVLESTRMISLVMKR